jgi:predicted O-methyltransferase YrrM
MSQVPQVEPGGSPVDAGAAVALLERADLVTPMALRVAATLRLADHIVSGSVDVASLAARTGAEVRPLRKVLEHLVALGIFAKSGSEYTVTEAGRPLLSSADDLGVRQFLDVEHVVGRSELSLVALLHTVRTGGAAYEGRYGRGLWEDLVLQGDAVRGIEAFQRDTVLFDAELVVNSYDWAGVNTVVDVGGNTGAMTVALLRAHPHLQATVVDLPCFAEPARANLRRQGLADRAEFISGDFFEALPPGHDVYLLSAILADWDDDAAVRILRCCASAAAPSGRVLLAEVHLQAAHADPIRTTAAAIRLEASMGNPDRTPGDLMSLAGRAGLTVTWRGPSSPVRSVLEVSVCTAGSEK